MPSEKILEQKKQIVEELVSKLTDNCAGVLVDYKGINVADDTALRRQLREANVEYTVVKNTLLSFAADKTGMADLKEHLKGTTAMAVSKDDYVAAARILCGYAKKNKNFTVKTGFIDGGVIDAQAVTELSALPSREVLIARALGGLNAPISGFAGVLGATLRSLVTVLDAVANKQSA